LAPEDDRELNQCADDEHEQANRQREFDGRLPAATNRPGGMAPHGVVTGG
jgi:hypothetical protein